jgi:hypothetical protein
MKKVILIIGMVLAVCVAVGETPETPEKHTGAHFAFETMEHNFGRIAHATKQAQFRFEFTNDGTEPLVITKTLTSCSCVKVSYDKKPIPVGGKGSIVVGYEVSKKEPGVFYKVIEVYSNTPEKRTNLVIRGNAINNK